jgi:hypothetical protein
MRPARIEVQPEYRASAGLFLKSRTCVHDVENDPTGLAPVVKVFFPAAAI